MRISATEIAAIERGRAASARGFTLLELLIVLAIIALGTTLIIPSISSGEAKIFSTQVRQAEAALNYARRMAIARSSPFIATFRYRDPDAPKFPAEAGSQGPPSQFQVPAWESEEVSIRFRNTLDDLPEDMEEIQITFFPQGGSSGGILNFQMNDYTASIRVDPITGRISSSIDEEDFE